MSVQTDDCLRCGGLEKVENLQNGLCPYCRRYPQGSYKWHLAVYFEDLEPEPSEEVYAFQAGWLRCLVEVRSRLADGDNISQVLKDLRAFDN